MAAKVKYEDIINELKENISKLEDPNLSLDDSLVIYEQATKLLKKAEEKLLEVEGKFKNIKIDEE
jgi:exonuclease VII small subunit